MGKNDPVTPALALSEHLFLDICLIDFQGLNI